MYNKVILIGNLTKDPELRYTGSGTPVSTLRLACTTKQKVGEELREETLFIDVTVWGRQAETCSQYLSKGRPVLVEGRLQERSWEQDGQKRFKTEIVARDIKFLGGGRGEQGQGGQGGGRQGQRSDYGYQGGQPPEEISDIEPF